MAHGGIEDNFGITIIFFLIVLFIVWLLTGGQNHEEAQKPFIKPVTDPIDPGGVYDPINKN